MQAINIQFTPAAIAHIQKMLEQEPGVFYLTVKQAGCSGYKYVPQIVASTAIGHAEPLVLSADLTVYVDSLSLPLLQGLQVDYVSKGLGQQQMVFMNPNAASECGCGESVFVDSDV